MVFSLRCALKGSQLPAAVRQGLLLPKMQRHRRLNLPRLWWASICSAEQVGKWGARVCRRRTRRNQGSRRRRAAKGRRGGRILHSLSLAVCPKTYCGLPGHLQEQLKKKGRSSTRSSNVWRDNCSPSPASPTSSLHTCLARCRFLLLTSAESD